VFTARYALSPYIKQIRFVLKGLKDVSVFKNYLYVLIFLLSSVRYRCKNPRRQIAKKTKICSVVPTVFWVFIASCFMSPF
jgi:hypothetical protein